MKKSLIIIGIVVVIILGAIGIKVLIDNNSEEEVQTGKVTTNLKNANENLKIASKNMTLDGKTAGYSSANPVIPKGFVTVDTENAKWVYTDNNKQIVQGWNDGLVIEDEKGNQFVWVPCNLDNEITIDGKKVAKYERWCSKEYEDAKDETTVNGITYKARPVENEDDQIKKYGGFYIARYEAGLDGIITEANSETNNVYTKVPVSKQGAQVWNYIDYTHSYVVADKMINDSNKYGSTKSGLVTGKQWDTIMKWYSNSGIIKLDGNGNQLSQNWGTYYKLNYAVSGYYFDGMASGGNTSTTWKQGDVDIDKDMLYLEKYDCDFTYLFHASGLNSNGIKKNIADLAGNLSEWSADELNQGIKCVRGGNAEEKPSDITKYDGNKYNSVTGSDFRDTDLPGDCIYGFRVVLYL